MGSSESYVAASAADKLRWMWARNVESAYDALPTEGPGGLESAKLLLVPYVRDTLAHVGDELPEGRLKLIHPHGTVARVHLRVLDPGPYTGLFAASVDGLVRFSDGAGDDSAPSMALKIPIDGRPSVNLLANPAIQIHADQPPMPHPLDVPLSSESPEPTRVQVKALEVIFDLAGKSMHGSCWRGAFQPLQPLASVTVAGKAVTEPRAPHRVDWQPHAGARAACVETGDWREGFAAIPEGTVLYTLTATAEAGAEPEPWAELILQTRFVASAWGDQRLFFQHQPETMGA